MRWRAEDRIYRKDEWVRQDTDELLGLEQKLNEMELSEKDRKVVDDYTACMESKQDRMGYLLYEAGMKECQTAKCESVKLSAEYLSQLQ